MVHWLFNLFNRCLCKPKLVKIFWIIIVAVMTWFNFITILEHFREVDDNINLDAYFREISPYFGYRWPEYKYFTGTIVSVSFNVHQLSGWVLEWSLLQLFFIHVSHTTIYNDYLLILYSTAISERFEQITKRIESRKSNNEIEKEFWRDIRADYISLAQLCKKLNKYVSLNVLMSFSGAMCMILGRLFTILR